jgi:hypothetical protein
MTLQNEPQNGSPAFGPSVGAGDGNRTHDIQLGKVVGVGLILLYTPVFRRPLGGRLGIFSGLTGGDKATITANLGAATESRSAPRNAAA